MRKLLIALFLFTNSALAQPITFTWDVVTKNIDGSPAGPVIYRLYKKSPTGPYLLLASKIANTYTWDKPALGDWTFTVRAMNQKGESADSNSVRVVVDSCWKEVTP